MSLTHPAPAGPAAQRPPVRHRHRPGNLRPVLREPGPIHGHRHLPVLADPAGDHLDHHQPGGGSAIGWDPYPFILLNLAFSTQAAYAAPLILLAQNRQDDRDRITLEEDRNRAAQTKADTEFLARELAALRVAIGEVATRDYLRGELDRLRGRSGGDDQPGRRRRHDQTDPGQGQEPVQVGPQASTGAHETGEGRCRGSAGRCWAAVREEDLSADADRSAADRRVTAA